MPKNLFQPTADDKRLELRDIQLEINKAKVELEILQRRKAEWDSWQESAGKSAEGFLEAVREEVEYTLWKELKNKDGQLAELNKSISTAHEADRSARDSVERKKKEILVLEKSLNQVKSEIVKVSQQYEAANQELIVLKNMVQNRRDALREEVTALEGQAEKLRSEIEAGTKEVDASKKYCKEWSDYLHQKERDLRLWEVRLARKLKKEMPESVLKFKEWDGRERHITIKP